MHLPCSRYLICRESELSAYDTPQSIGILSVFPRLVMSLTISHSTRLCYAYRLHLYRPATSWTVFGVIGATPIYHECADHRECPKDSYLSIHTNALDHDGVSPPFLMPAAELREFSIGEQGRLIPEEPGSDTDWYTQVDFLGTRIRDDSMFHQTVPERYIDSIIDILQLCGRHHYPNTMMFHEDTYLGFHVAMILDEDVWDDFIKKVSLFMKAFYPRESLFAFVRTQLSTASDRCPEIMLCRLQIFIRLDPGQITLSRMAEQLGDIYDENLLALEGVIAGAGYPHVCARISGTVWIYGPEEGGLFDVDNWSAYESDFYANRIGPPHTAHLQLVEFGDDLAVRYRVLAGEEQNFYDWPSRAPRQNAPVDGDDDAVWESDGENDADDGIHGAVTPDNETADIENAHNEDFGNTSDGGENADYESDDEEEPYYDHSYNTYQAIIEDYERNLLFAGNSNY